jgi:uncharacterized protein
MLETFDLVLMVNHACNLRCAYCYTGAKFWRSLDQGYALRAVNRALRSIAPGGTLELGFFGGEPLLESHLILDVIAHAQRRCSQAGIVLRMGLTTNGTITNSDAWRVMTLPGLELSVSHDGLPQVHDRYRVGLGGTSNRETHGSAAHVAATIQRVIEGGQDARVSMVVRPDTVQYLPDGIRWLRERGICHVDPTLDLWSPWNTEQANVLVDSVIQCADLWREGLPDCSIGWFDEKAMRLARLPSDSTARCGYGNGQIAVAPSGRLYPCERVIGEDRDDNPTRLPGHVMLGDTFARDTFPARSNPECSSCAIADQCNTFCRCSNYIRTGDVSQPDALLCLLDKACFRETVRILRMMESQGESRHRKERSDERRQVCS